MTREEKSVIKEAILESETHGWKDRPHNGCYCDLCEAVREYIEVQP